VLMAECSNNFGYKLEKFASQPGRHFDELGILIEQLD